MDLNTLLIVPLQRLLLCMLFLGAEKALADSAQAKAAHNNIAQPSPVQSSPNQDSPAQTKTVQTNTAQPKPRQFKQIQPSQHSPAKLDQLARSKQWRRLLYFADTQPSLGRDKSQLDDSQFFLAKNGKYSPKDELLATLLAMLTSVDHPKNQDKQDKHALCRFPARAAFLLKSGVLEAKQLPKVTCLKYQKWQKDFAADSATLIFPSAYINSPASMFGHLFLRLDQKKYINNPTLLPTANFAAKTPEQFSPPMYVIKGLVGGYPGRYSIHAYYKKLKKYVDLENRSVWEYPIKLTKPQVDMLNKLLWEVMPYHYDYFFMDENCAYRVITLLEAAVSDLSITKNYPIRALPTDMIRDLKAAGLLGKPSYRASGMDTFLAHYYALDPQTKQLVRKWQALAPAQLTKAVAKTPKELAATTLEVVHEYNQIKAHTNKKTDKALNKRLLRALTERAKLDSKPLKPAKPPAQSPEEGHPPIALSYGAGARVDALNKKGSYMTLGFRSLNHDINDPSLGYLPGSELVAANIQARVYSKNGATKLQLDRVDLARLSTVRPISQFFTPLSWQGQLGGERCSIAQQNWMNRFEAGVGYSLGTINPARAWQHVVTGFAVLQLRDRSCLQQPVSGSAQYVDVYPKIQWLTQHDKMSFSYTATLQEQGKLIDSRAALFIHPTKSQKWNIGVQAKHTQDKQSKQDVTEAQLRVNFYRY